MTSPPSHLPLCDRCSEPISSFEEAIPTAGHRLFHRNCFACSKRKCGQILSLAEYGVHQNQIFCPNCFLFLLRPHLNGKLAINGNGGGNGADKAIEGDDDTQNGAQGPIIRCRSYEHQLRTLQLNEDEEEGNGDGEVESTKSGLEGEGEEEGDGKDPLPTILIRVDRKIIKNDCCPFGASPIPEADELQEESQPTSPLPPPSSAFSPTWRIQSSIPKSSPKFSPNGQTNSLGSSIIPFRPSNCKRCSGRVYEAEKVVAASEVWHKCCFRCLRCGRSLEPGKFSDRIGEIYCNSCYAKEFGPKGVGCGVGAGILQMYQ